VGINVKGIEINPRMLRIVDNPNQYHLLEPPEGQTGGIGFKEGFNHGPANIIMDTLFPSIRIIKYANSTASSTSIFILKNPGIFKKIFIILCH
jgi:hypothetical protein